MAGLGSVLPFHLNFRRDGDFQLDIILAFLYCETFSSLCHSQAGELEYAISSSLSIPFCLFDGGIKRYTTLSK